MNKQIISDKEIEEWIVSNPFRYEFDPEISVVYTSEENKKITEKARKEFKEKIIADIKREKYGLKG